MVLSTSLPPIHVVTIDTANSVILSIEQLLKEELQTSHSALVNDGTKLTKFFWTRLLESQNSIELQIIYKY